MNLNIGELYKKVASLLIVLGVVLLIISAIGAIPTGNQASIKIDENWRYILLAVGCILIIVGIIFGIKELGITENFNLKGRSSHRVEFIQEYPENYLKDMEASNDLWLIGATLGKTIRENYSMFSQKLQRGEQIKVLIVHPEGASVEMLATRYCSPVNQKPEAQARRINEVLENFCKLKELFPGKIQIKTINNPLTFGAIAINLMDSAGTLYLEHYPYRTISGAVPKFVIPGNNDDWYEFFRKEILSLWENGVDWSCKTKY